MRRPGAFPFTKRAEDFFGAFFVFVQGPMGKIFFAAAPVTSQHSTLGPVRARPLFSVGAFS
jgi:hypothetical protein